MFAHGKESGPWGSKITYLAAIARQLGATVISPDYSAWTDPNERVAHLLARTEVSSPAYSSKVLVGSSMGGYVSTVASQTVKPAGLFLLAPAFGIAHYPQQYPVSGAVNTEIVMGWQDEIIPVTNIIHYATQFQLPLHLMKADHRLNSVLPAIGCLFRCFLERTLDSNV